MIKHMLNNTHHHTMGSHAITVFSMWLFFVPLEATAQGIPGLRQEPKLFVAPGQEFTLKVPAGWQIALAPDQPGQVEFRPPGQFRDSFLIIRRYPVPAGAHPRQLLLRALETRLSKLPAFEKVNQRDVSIGGHPGAAIIGKYAHQGNLQYPRAIEEIFVVVGEEAFAFHFECFQPHAPALASAVNVLYSTFMPRAKRARPKLKSPGTSTDPIVDKVPY